MQVALFHTDFSQDVNIVSHRGAVAEQKLH